MMSVKNDMSFYVDNTGRLVLVLGAAGKATILDDVTPADAEGPDDIDRDAIPDTVGEYVAEWLNTGDRGLAFVDPARCGQMTAADALAILGDAPDDDTPAPVLAHWLFLRYETTDWRQELFDAGLTTFVPGHDIGDAVALRAKFGLLGPGERRDRARGRNVVIDKHGRIVRHGR